MNDMVNFRYTDDLDLYAHLWHEGKNDRAYEFLGSHFVDDGSSVRFCVWAPNAQFVNLIGDFNNWDELSLPLKRIQDSGVWEITVDGVENYDSYKYRIVGPSGEIRYKVDPFAFHFEERPKSASKVYDLRGYEWGDKRWMNARAKSNSLKEPMSIYEVNLSSWRKNDNNSNYSYEMLADELVKYVKDMKFTHVELMPVTEYPYDGSWGYQVLGYFAPTSRFGTPKDFMYLVDSFHKAGIGVILDWVPVHFVKDDHGLARFDGTNIYEDVHQYRAENKHWGTLNFDYSKREVVNFLISSALYWFEHYHIDGLRVDAVAYMIYNDMDRGPIAGINENAVSFIKELNEKIHQYHPDVIMIAEESSAYPNITKPVKEGGLGFTYKWNMGWMRDTIDYMHMDPLFRSDNHNQITFSMMYAFSENYVLPFSHDEVVHAKGSMLNTMHGSYEERFKQLRLLYSYMYCHPGKKLNFMGNEFAQFDEWDEWSELDWELLEFDSHKLFQDFFRELNRVYRTEPALYQIDDSFEGFLWLDVNNSDESIFAFEREAEDGDKVICVFNFTGVERPSYPIGVDQKGNYTIILNTDHRKFGGETSRNPYFTAKKKNLRLKDYIIEIDIPAFGAMLIKKK